MKRHQVIVFVAAALLASCFVPPGFSASIGQKVTSQASLGYVTPQQFGTVDLTGSTDMSSLIQAAINSLGSNGGVVYLCAGRWKTHITVPDHVTLIGAGIDRTYVAGFLNEPIISAPNDRFSIRDMTVIGPNNAAYTNSVGIYTGPTNAHLFDIENVWVQYCYDGIVIDGSSGSSLTHIFASKNIRDGIRSLGGQGDWEDINTFVNGGDGLHVGNGTVNNTAASPWINGYQSFGNVGWGVNVYQNGLILNNYFINNDYAGEINVQSGASGIQVGVGQIQYAGLSPYNGTNNTAPGIYIASGYTYSPTIDGAQFFGNEGNDIDLQCLNAASPLIGNIISQGAGSGGQSGHVYAINSVANSLVVSQCRIAGAVKFSGSYNVWGPGTISLNSDSIPTFHVDTGATYTNLSGLTLYQSGTGKAFVSETGTTYSLAGVQVLGGSSSSGSVITVFTGTP